MAPRWSWREVLLVTTWSVRRRASPVGFLLPQKKIKKNMGGECCVTLWNFFLGGKTVFPGALNWEKSAVNEEGRTHRWRRDSRLLGPTHIHPPPSGLSTRPSRRPLTHPLPPAPLGKASRSSALLRLPPGLGLRLSAGEVLNCVASEPTQPADSCEPRPRRCSPEGRGGDDDDVKLIF